MILFMIIILKSSDHNIYGNKTVSQNINLGQQKINENVSEIFKNKKKTYLDQKFLLIFSKVIHT